ncbi:MAG: hypothetical protein ACPLW6_04350 [Desulfurella sp.]|jgi:hypothetical protein|uniref:Lipoprotein n=1 Tax=Desulfurella multipotens TaxID=79269 RepID=A0A1G6PM27_9BACT|nr:hypothetical protein [Desulfurella multipotens]PMP63420.1 MAG: hypothetical protein C0192_07720 [Desulfurella multipotens]SDC81098.1 hypothetical protein SAMN05660835_01411 [Desulfurella multipotens]HEX13473.1 hypothetical protein [Desulfurella acetivorans]
MRKIKFFFPVLMLIFIASCTQMQQVGFRSYETEFSKNLDKQTQEKKLYRDFETIAIAKVTYFNSALANQYYNYLKQHNAISSSNEKLYESFVNECSKNTVFWVNLYSSDYESSNISSKNSFWNIYLDCNGEKIQPLKIEKVSKDSPLNVWLYLKPKNYWSNNYIVEFNKSCLNNSIDFNMASIVGSLDFKF